MSEKFTTIETREDAEIFYKLQQENAISKVKKHFEELRQKKKKSPSAIEALNEKEKNEIAKIETDIMKAKNIMIAACVEMPFLGSDDSDQ